MVNKANIVFFIKRDAAVYHSKTLNTSINAIDCKTGLHKSEISQ